MSKYIFIEKPSIEKGRKIVNLILTDNKGNVVYTEWKNTCDDKELLKRIKELEKIDKEVSKKLKLL